MQTFLAYQDFPRALQCLDNKRLGKQRPEAKQILNALQPGSTSRWRNHPAVKMWRGYENSLALYHSLCIEEWINRGDNNNMKFINPQGRIIHPRWLGDEKFHSAHRQTLLSKDLNWSSRFNWKEEPKYEYIWPV